MEIIIHQAILHVLDTTMDAPVLSGSGMEMTAEKTAYFQYHIEKLLASDDIRQCRPLPDSAFKNELEHNHDFVDLSCRIAGVLFDYMHAHTTIPGADLAVVDFTRDGEPWLGILKLNYKNGYTHYTENVEGAPVNSIIQQRACLPSQSGKVEEGALVNLTDYSMKLLEKKFDIDGHKDFYLSTVVFQYTTAQPEKKKLQAIQEAAVQAVQENYADQPHVEAQVAMLIANQAADNDNQVSIQQVRQQLEEEYPLAAVPFDDYVEKSDVLEAPEQPVTVTPARIRRMESRSIHTANGIEVKIPTELLNEESEVEFLHDADGSVSLLIDIENCIKAQQSAGYERWAKIENLKRAARTMVFLDQHGISRYTDLEQKITELQDSNEQAAAALKTAERRLSDLALLIKHTTTYKESKPLYSEYKKSRDKEKYLRGREREIILFEASARALKAAGVGDKLPDLAKLREEYSRLSEEKDRLYAEYGSLKKRMREYDAVKQNIDSILSPNRGQEQDKAL